tara:strand:- start:372 stop:716 length:345 start_codon:yes stop_codon:yes gene_type:complete
MISSKKSILFFPIIFGSISGALLRSSFDDYFIPNIIGSFIIGFALSISRKKIFYNNFLITFCPALTTFSTWLIDCFVMINNGEIFKALSYICYGVLIGFLSCSLGFLLGQRLRL